MSRTLGFIIFFSIVIVLYGLINTYIYLRGLQALPHPSPLRLWFSVVFWFLAGSYFAARLLERISVSWLTDALIWIGSFWLGAMAYFIVVLLAIDIIRLANFIVPFFPESLTRNIQHVKQVLFVAVGGIVILAVIGSRLNAMFPTVKTLNLTIKKKSPLKELNIALASDIHLGTVVCNNHFERIVQKINALHPDLVLLPGDIVDEDIEPVIRQNLGETISQIHSKYGIFAVTGNHEYIGGVEPACKYLAEHGIVMLRDSSATVAGSFILVGREDRSIRQFSGKKRKSLSEIMAGVDTSLPVILMDHQPLDLGDAADARVDLQFSGHTHHGQLWPFNFITKAVYELSWGYAQKGNTQYYVSCGVGTWGPPMRSGNRPEVVNVKLRFEASR
jgi:predicted MPP superfamily phosphohydrolase